MQKGFVVTSTRGPHMGRNKTVRKVVVTSTWGPHMGRNKTVRKVVVTSTWGPHMGRNKTVRRVLQCFYWPNIYLDVAEWCRNCPNCQKAQCRNCPNCQKAHNKRTQPVPLVPLSVMTEPFSLIAMDTLWDCYFVAGEGTNIGGMRLCNTISRCSPTEILWGRDSHRRVVKRCSLESEYQRKF